MKILAFGIDEVAKGVFGCATATIHHIRVVIGRLAEHIVLARRAASVDEFVAPVEDFVAIGDGDDGDGE